MESLEKKTLMPPAWIKDGDVMRERKPTDLIGDVKGVELQQTLFPPEDPVSTVGDIMNMAEHRKTGIIVTPLKLNVGCGPIKFPGFINVDAYDKDADIICDARNLSSEFKPDSVDEIQAHHLVEHFAGDETEGLLRDWHKILKPGGKLVIELPDLEANCREYGRANWNERWPLINTIHGLKGPGMQHLFGWSYDLLSEMMRQWGYVGWQKRRAIQSIRDNKQGYSMRIVAYKPPMPKYPKLSIVVSIYNSKPEVFEIFKQCIGYTPYEIKKGLKKEGILNTTYEDCEIILIDNGSNQETVNLIRELQQEDQRIVYCRYEQPLGATRAANMGLQLARGEYVIYMNSDAIILEWGPNWIERLLKPFEDDPTVGITGTLLNKNQGRDFLVFFLTCISREVINKIGYFDEIFNPGAGEDTDYCWRTEAAGFKFVCITDQKWSQDINLHVCDYPVYHKGEVTVNTLPNWNEIFERNAEILKDRYAPKP